METGISRERTFCGVYLSTAAAGNWDGHVAKPFTEKVGMRKGFKAIGKEASHKCSRRQFQVGGVRWENRCGRSQRTGGL